MASSEDDAFTSTGQRLQSCTIKGADEPSFCPGDGGCSHDGPAKPGLLTGTRTGGAIDGVGSTYFGEARLLDGG